jgi:predicted DsbA family dithiol-disulfide isomerase
VRTDRLQQEFGVEIRWTVFPLHPETPEEGMELSELFAGREGEIEAMQIRLGQVAAAEGLPLSKRTRTYNSRRAQELGKWAESLGKGDAFRSSVYRAYFVDGINIALVDELTQIAESISLDIKEARLVLTTGSFSKAVDADWQRSANMRITSVPTHLCEGKKLAGFGPYDNFVRLIGRD